MDILPIEALHGVRRMPTVMGMTILPDNFGRRVGNLDELPLKLREQLQLGKDTGEQG